MFYLLQKRKNILNYCKSKNIYGYFYLEFKDKFYYWEFVRIYLKVAIVCLYDLFLYSKYTILSKFFIILMLMTYVSVTNIYRPFQNNQKLNMEIRSYSIIIFNLVLQLLFEITLVDFFQYLMGIVHFLYIVYIFLVFVKIKFFGKKNAILEKVKNWAIKQLSK